MCIHPQRILFVICQSKPHSFNVIKLTKKTLKFQQATSIFETLFLFE